MKMAIETPEKLSDSDLDAVIVYETVSLEEL